MSVWGPGLYQNDIAADLKSKYIDKLHRGKTGEQVTQELMREFECEVCDEEEAVDFWLALADIQWEYGRLEEFVKNRALEYIREEKGIDYWNEVSRKDLEKRKKIYIDLENKLRLLPPEKKCVSQYRLYFCEWKKGDVYAYLLEGTCSIKKGIAGRYLLFQKIDEGIWHPGHIIPVVRVKLSKEGKLPSSGEEFDALEYIQTSFTRNEDRLFPDVPGMTLDEWNMEKARALVDEFGYLPEYQVKLICTSKRSIPKKIIYLGNFQNVHPPKNEFVHMNKQGILACKWKNIEEEIITRYYLYNKRESPAYAKKI